MATPTNKRTWKEQAERFTAFVTALSLAITLVSTVGWFALGPWVNPYLVAIEAIPELAKRVDAIERKFPPTTFVEFGGPAFVFPDEVYPGDHVRVRYERVRWNFS